MKPKAIRGARDAMPVAFAPDYGAVFCLDCLHRVPGGALVIVEPYESAKRLGWLVAPGHTCKKLKPKEGEPCQPNR